MKKVSAFIFAAIAFLSFSSVAFADSFQVVNTNDDITFTTNLSAPGTCQVYNNGIGTYVSFPGGIYGNLSCSSDGKSITFNSALPDNTYTLHVSMSGTVYTSLPFTISGGVCTSGCSTNGFQVVNTNDDITFTTNLSAPGTCQVFNGNFGTYVSFNSSPGGLYGNVSCSSDGKSITFNSALPDNTYTLHVSMSGTEYISQPFTISGGVCTSGCPTPPSIQLLSNATINEGDTYSASGSFTDSNTNATSWSATVDYGEGAGAEVLSLNPDKTFSLSHLYKDNKVNNAPYAVTVSITDDQGGTGTQTAQVTVNNVAPTPGAITAPSSPVLVNTAITASANFTDPGVLDTHTASWNWGDGTTPTTCPPNTSQCTLTESNGSGTVSGSHTYTATGVYTITLTVTDKDGGVGTSTFQYVSVYDSNSSFAGGRSFDNPSSASPSTTGRVSFGISAKYNNSNVLTGTAKMDFKAASPSLDFASTSLSSLATSNGKAYLKGSGTLNGNSGYTFLASGIDGSVAGGSDLIRFQIKDSSNNVVYDSQPGAGDTADPTTLDATGNIRVH